MIIRQGASVIMNCIWNLPLDSGFDGLHGIPCLLEELGLVLKHFLVDGTLASLIFGFGFHRATSEQKDNENQKYRDNQKFAFLSMHEASLIEWFKLCWKS